MSVINGLTNTRIFNIFKELSVASIQLAKRLATLRCGSLERTSLPVTTNNHHWLWQAPTKIYNLEKLCLQLARNSSIVQGRCRRGMLFIK